MLRLTTWIFGLLAVGLIVTLFTTAAVEMYADDPSLDYNSNSSQKLASIDQINNITALAEDLRDSSQKAGVETGVVDILGNFFTKGYKTLLLAGTSTDLGISMAEASIDNANIGVSGSILKSVLIAMLLVGIFVGILVAAIIKRDT